MPFQPAQLLPPKRWQRVVLFAVVGLFLLAGAAWLAVPRFLEPTIRRKLQAMVSSRMDARLDLGGLTYLPPYGVRVRDATLVAPDPAGGGDVQVLKVDTLVLRLARPPWKKGPLVIKSLEVNRPAVHLIQSPQGMIGAHRFVREQPATQPANDDPLAGQRKLSDMFELRHFVITDGEVVYEDRGRPGTVPMVWKGFAVDLKTGPTSKSLYEYTFDASHGEVANFSSAGSFDLDALHLDARKLNLNVLVKSDDATSPLPAALQGVLRDNYVNGRLTLDAKAAVPLKDPKAAHVEADFHLQEATARSPAVEDFPLDRLAVRLHAEMKPGAVAAPQPTTGPSPTTKPAAPSVFVRLDAFDAASAGRTVRLDKAELRVDPAANVWKLSGFAGKVDFGAAGPVAPPVATQDDSADDKAPESPASRPAGPLLDRLALAGEVTFSVAAEGPVEPPAGQSVRETMKVEAVAYPRGLRVRPPKFPHPLTDVGGGGSVALRGDVLVLQDLTGRYGKDELRLDGLRLRIPKDLSDFRKTGYRVEEITGAVTFHPPRQEYPRKLEKTFRRLNPTGTFLIGGGSWFEVARVRPDPGMSPPSDGWWKSSYFFDIAADGAGNFYVSPRRIPLERMRGYARVSSLLIDIPRLEADLFGGRAIGSGNITPGKPWIFQGQARLRDADLKEAGRFFPPEKQSDKLSGKGNVNIEFAGTMTADAQGGSRPKDTLRAAGEFEVLEGDFWSLPGLAEVAEQVRKKDPLTVGEAAGVFEVSEREIRFRQAAISSPALGLLGSGTVGFDNTMDLRLVAAPLGDWRDRMKQARVPIVSDVAAEVVGGVQKLVNAAAGTLLYEFRVTGKASKPDLKVVPAPVLSDPAALLFGQMVEPKKDRRLIDSVRDDRRDGR